MEQPNFNRIAWVLNYFEDDELEKADYCFNDIEVIDQDNFFNWNDRIKELILLWEDNASGEPDCVDNQSLLALLKEYEMEEFLPDFKLLALLFTLQVKDAIMYNSFSKEDNKKTLRQLQRLSILTNENDVNLRVILKKKSSVFIDDIESIEAVKLSQIDLFKKTTTYKVEESIRHFFKRHNRMPSIDSDPGLYFKMMLEKFKSSYFKPGGNEKYPGIYEVALGLQDYLSSFTKLKIPEGKKYSNQQAKFIYEFLYLLSLIEKPSSGSDPADFIANNFLNKKIKRNSLTKNRHQGN